MILFYLVVVIVSLMFVTLLLIEIFKKDGEQVVKPNGKYKRKK